jgi:hypothetical protein
VVAAFVPQRQISPWFCSDELRWLNALLLRQLWHPSIDTELGCGLFAFVEVLDEMGIGK